ncbi:MAG: hypothetical protein AAFW81_03855 [Pseudomonadota bacterium]
MPQHSAVPAVAALAAYYLGAKYGAPDLYVNSVDGALSTLGDFISGLGAGDDGATTADG